MTLSLAYEGICTPALYNIQVHVGAHIQYRFLLSTSDVVALVVCLSIMSSISFRTPLMTKCFVAERLFPRASSLFRNRDTIHCLYFENYRIDWKVFGCKAMMCSSIAGNSTTWSVSRIFHSLLLVADDLTKYTVARGES